MKRRSRSQRLVSEINITPFTDVILVLLIIFMVTTPLLFRSGIKVQLPRASQTQEPPQNIDITISEDGRAVLEDSQYNLRYDLGLLRFKLAALAKKKHVSAITISGDKEVKYDFVVKVMDIAKQVGIERIVLSTEFRS
ncbi:MAG: biopolymer transporter ExbD [Candidatus Omnitrophota bacterium]|jgi:biopolymer transport protein ExbD